MSSYPLYYPMPKAILAYRDIISLFQGGLHTIITSVSEISGISAKTLLTCSIICGPNGHPIEVNVISTVHKPSSSTSTLYTKPKLTISILTQDLLPFQERLRYYLLVLLPLVSPL